MGMLARLIKIARHLPRTFGIEESVWSLVKNKKSRGERRKGISKTRERKYCSKQLIVRWTTTSALPGGFLLTKKRKLNSAGRAAVTSGHCHQNTRRGWERGLGGKGKMEDKRQTPPHRCCLIVEIALFESV